MISIDWIRHGYSCGNAKIINAGQKGKIEIIEKMKNQVPNPSLTNMGVQQCYEVGYATNVTGGTILGRYQHYDAIFCSDLMRAMETSINIFHDSDRKITVLPYIQEMPAHHLLSKFRIDVENKVQMEKVVIDRLKKFGYDTSRFDYSLYNTICQGKYQSPNYKKFLEKVVIEHLTNPKSKYYFKESRFRTLRIAIVSHQGYIKKIVKQSTQAESYYDKEALYKGVNCYTDKSTPQYLGFKAIGNTGIMSSLLSCNQIKLFIKGKTNRMNMRLYRIYEREGLHRAGECVGVSEKNHWSPQNNKIRNIDLERCPYKIRRLRKLPSPPNRNLVLYQD